MSTQDRIIQARKAIRQKLHALRAVRISREQTLQDTFKPITDTIERVAVNTADKDDMIEDFVKKHSSSAIDKTFGVNNGMLGAHKIRLTRNTLHIGTVDFEPTEGLLNLIFLKNPTGYSRNELETYGEILRITNAHKTPDGRNKKIRNGKYIHIIKPALYRVGGGAIDIAHKEVNAKIPQYIYFDDVNELVDRLRLLIASSSAGNNSHRNEIISIVSELRERGVINGNGG